MKLNVGDKEFYRVTSNWLDEEAFRNYPHTGIDLALESGTDIYSPIDGVITRVADFGGENTGKTIYMKTGDETVIFGHLSDIDVKEGDIVDVGDIIGQSGNSGHSTGDHLHIGLKDANGNFINPEDVENRFQHVASEMSKIKEESGGGMGGFLETVTDMRKYFQEVKLEGFWEATFDMSFPELMIAGFRNTVEFIFTHNDLFLIYPAIFFMLATFVIGKNKLTKWIIPCWMGYFVTTVLRYIYFGH